MRRLWAPWRMAYIKEIEKITECIFCSKPLEDKDDKNFIVYRGKFTFVILNIFPYNSGHLMVAPYRHIGNLEDINKDESEELWHLLNISVKTLKEVFNPDGFNIGINLGKAAGAGFDEHVHFHIVPRWTGDTNFMPVLGETKVIPEALKETYERVKPIFLKLAKE